MANWLTRRAGYFFTGKCLNDETRTEVQKYTNDIKALMRRSSQDIIDIGQKLIEVKQRLQHGNFTKWLKSEFNWSVSTATKLMQVGEQFKFVNFTNLNITASALYLIAAPSIPKDVRTEVLQRASLGESIGYTKAKEIVSKYQKNADIEPKQQFVGNCKFIQPTKERTFAPPKMSELTVKKTETGVILQLKKDDISYVGCKNCSIGNTIEDIRPGITRTLTNMSEPTTVDDDFSNAAIAELVIKIKKLSPEQLVEVITKSANSGLTCKHLETLIAVCEQMLKSIPPTPLKKLSITRIFRNNCESVYSRFLQSLLLRLKFSIKT